VRKENGRRARVPPRQPRRRDPARDDRQISRLDWRPRSCITSLEDRTKPDRAAGRDASPSRREAGCVVIPRSRPKRDGRRRGSEERRRRYCEGLLSKSSASVTSRVARGMACITTRCRCASRRQRFDVTSYEGRVRSSRGRANYGLILLYELAERWWLRLSVSAERAPWALESALARAGTKCGSAPWEVARAPRLA